MKSRILNNTWNIGRWIREHFYVLFYALLMLPACIIGGLFQAADEVWHDFIKPED